MTSRSPRRSPLAMAVLLLLAEQPLHPYGLRQQIQEWDKDRVINVTQRNAIYQIIERLERAGLLEVRETARNDRRPERTVYETTDDGIVIARRWLLETLATPGEEYPEFPAALAFACSVNDKEMLDALEARAKALADKIASLETEVMTAAAKYLHAVWRAELRWLGDTIGDLRRSP